MQYNIFICFAFILSGVQALRIFSSGPTSELDATWNKRCPAPPNTTYSASRPDGFGEQYAGQMLILGLARHCNGCYKFEGFKRKFSSKWGAHDQWDPDPFVGLRSDVNCTGVSARHFKFAMEEMTKKTDGLQSFRDEFFSKEVRDELRASYWSNTKMGRDSDCEVVFHDRRGDATLGGDVQLRSSGNELLRITIERQFANKRVCIISQGQPAEFGPLQKMLNVKLKLDDSTQEAFHNMLTAPELVIGHSSLSWAAGILSTAPVYFFPFAQTVPGSFHGMELSTWRQIEVTEDKNFEGKSEKM